MLKRREEIAGKSLRAKLHAAYVDPAVQCQTPYLKDGLPYRLEPKPAHARVHRITRAGHDTETIDGVVHVRVPLGVHGADHLGIDPETGEIGCVLCVEGGKQ